MSAARTIKIVDISITSTLVTADPSSVLHARSKKVCERCGNRQRRISVHPSFCHRGR